MSEPQATSYADWNELNLDDLDKVTGGGLAGDVNSVLNSMSDMSEMQSMRLQMAMDRTSKFTEALSNILKAGSDTASRIVGNMK